MVVNSLLESSKLSSLNMKGIMEGKAYTPLTPFKSLSTVNIRLSSSDFEKHLYKVSLSKESSIVIPFSLKVVNRSVMLMYWTWP